MKHSSMIVWSSLCLALTALAHAEVTTNNGPRPLTENQMDLITAGSEGTHQTAGGSVVADGSTAQMTFGGTVELTDEAGQEAQGLNLGNAADSVISNALNIWDGRLESQSVATGLSVEQLNLTQQDGAHSASVTDYTRGASSFDTSEATTTSTSAGSSSLVTNTMVDTNQTIGGGGLSLGSSDGGTTGGDAGGSSGGSGGGMLGVPEVAAQVGKGVALGGTVDFSIGAAELSVGIDAGASLSNSTSNDTLLQSGQTSGPLGGSLTGPSASNSFQNDFELSGQVSANYEVSTPDISFEVAGSGCFVMVGGCAADATETADWDDTSGTSDTSTSLQRGALEVGNNSGEYIVIDDSGLTVESLYSVILSGSAQQGVQAMNLINASGSMVSNSVNISRTPTVGPELSLIQSNVVTQHR